MSKPRKPKSKSISQHRSSSSSTKSVVSGQGQPAASVEAQLKIGIGYGQAGKFAEAEACFQQILQLHPTYPDAWHFFGVVAAQQRQYAIAEERMRRSITLNPQAAAFHNNLGNVLREQGKLVEAIAACQQAVQLAPNFANAHHTLGATFQAQGKFAEAVAAYQTAIRSKPDNASFHRNLASALKEQGKLLEAIAACQQAVQLAPNFADAHNTLGAVLQAQGKFPESKAAYQTAIQLEPNNALYHCNLGNILREQGQLMEAIAACQKALQLAPNFADAYNTLGNILQAQDQFAEARTAYQTAIQLDPRNSSFYSNFGVFLQSQGDFTGAIDAWQTAIRLNPEYPDTHWNLSLGLLLLENYQQGWAEYEWRFERSGFIKKALTTPMWQQLPTNENILLWAEQGLGDSIQFIRYGLLLQQQGVNVTIATKGPLIRLFQECLFDSSVVVLNQDRADLSSYEIHTSVMSLPRLFQTDSDTIPAAIPYIQVSGNIPDRLKLPPDDSLKIGAVWASDSNNIGLYQKKSIPLELFLQPFKNLDYTTKLSLVSLQVGPDAAPIASWSPLVAAHDLSPLLQDFVDTAWAIEQLDLVITVDTAVAHLAGAMSKPVWVLLPFAPDWRWLIDRQDSPWYPTMRLFRQTSPGDWQTVLAQVQERLQHVLLGEPVVFPIVN